MRSIIEGRNFDSSSLLPFPLSLSLTTSPLEKRNPGSNQTEESGPGMPKEPTPSALSLYS